jgi:hypothetical protein
VRLSALPGGFVVEDPAVVVGAGEAGGGGFVEEEVGSGVELEGAEKVEPGSWKRQRMVNHATILSFLK